MKTPDCRSKPWGLRDDDTWSECHELGCLVNLGTAAIENLEGAERYLRPTHCRNLRAGLACVCRVAGPREGPLGDLMREPDAPDVPMSY